jgi:hypothetical protein
VFEVYRYRNQNTCLRPAPAYAHRQGLVAPPLPWSTHGAICRTRALMGDPGTIPNLLLHDKPVPLATCEFAVETGCSSVAAIRAVITTPNCT